MSRLGHDIVSYVLNASKDILPRTSRLLRLINPQVMRGIFWGARNQLMNILLLRDLNQRSVSRIFGDRAGFRPLDLLYSVRWSDWFKLDLIMNSILFVYVLFYWYTFVESSGGGGEGMMNWTLPFINSVKLNTLFCLSMWRFLWTPI